MESGVLGAIRGKIGPVVGATWMGEPYYRSRPKSRSKKRGRVEAHNQENFAILHSFLHPLLPFVREGFRGYSPRVQGYNAAKSYGMKNAFAGEKGNKVLDPSKVQVSFGNLPLPADMSMEKQDGVVRFQWDTNIPQGASRYDQAMLLVYNPESGGCNMKLTGQFREAGEDELKLPKVNGATWHVYMAFVADDRSRQSHSVYLGTVV